MENNNKDFNARVDEIFALANRITIHVYAMDDERHDDLKVRDAALYELGTSLGVVFKPAVDSLEDWLLKMGCDPLNAAEGVLALLADVAIDQARVDAALQEVDDVLADEYRFGDLP